MTEIFPLPVCSVHVGMCVNVYFLFLAHTLSSLIIRGSEYECCVIDIATSSDEEEEDPAWEVQGWRVESYRQDCFLEEQRKMLQVTCNFYDLFHLHDYFRKQVTRNS